jgi:hypothetical protein
MKVLAPELSVGMIAGELRSRAARSLQCLLTQTAIERMEIIVVDFNPELVPLPGSEHASVRYLARPHFNYYCEAQAELVTQARAPLLAFIEDHCYAVPRWAEAILDKFQHPMVSAVNYTFVPASSGYMCRSILMAEYGLWMAPHPGGPIGIASSTNIAYRRDLLLAMVQKDPSRLEAEFLVHRAIQKHHGQIHIAPEAAVAHETWSTLREACLANGANKQVLGSRRAVDGDWGLPRRIAWAAGMFLMPGLGMARIAWAIRTRTPLWRPFLAGLPVMAVIYSYCAWREASGYLFGECGSRSELRSLELDVRRDG